MMYQHALRLEIETFFFKKKLYNFPTTFGTLANNNRNADLSNFCCC